MPHISPAEVTSCAWLCHLLQSIASKLILHFNWSSPLFQFPSFLWSANWKVLNLKSSNESNGPSSELGSLQSSSSHCQLTFPLPLSKVLISHRVGTQRMHLLSFSEALALVRKHLWSSKLPVIPCANPFKDMWSDQSQAVLRVPSMSLLLLFLLLTTPTFSSSPPAGSRFYGNALIITSIGKQSYLPINIFSILRRLSNVSGGFLFPLLWWPRWVIGTFFKRLVK